MSPADLRAHAQPAHRHGKAMMRPTTHDPYRAAQQPADPSQCPGCGAVYEDGRWQWKEPLAASAPQAVCPACRRQRAGDAAGWLRVHGPFFAAHREELLQRLRHYAEHEADEHPQQRILTIDDDEADGVLVSATSVRLARGLGQALQRAYKGGLQMHLSPAQELVRIEWYR